MSKTLRCLLSVFIAVALVLTAIPFTAMAEEIVLPADETATETTLPDDAADAETDMDAESDTQEPYIIGELVEKRESNVKHFRMSDGTINAVYYTQSVHYEDENGDLKDIDNSLDATVDDTDDAFGNKANDFVVKFMKKSNENKLYTLTKGEHKIKVSIDNVSKVDVLITDVENDDKSPFKIENSTGKAVYRDIFENTDIEYTVVSNNIKENIILKSAVDFSKLVYTYKIGSKLKAVAKDEKNVDIIDRESGEIIFSISAPVMWDSEGNRSENLTFKITKETNTTVQIALSWDKEFLEDAVYPVTVDPVHKFPSTKETIEDTHIMAQRANEVLDGLEHIRVRYDCYALVKLPLPDMTPGDKIVKAELFLWPLAQGATVEDKEYENANSFNPKLYITAHKVLREWSEETVTYTSANPQNGFYDSTAYSYRVVDNDTSVYNWDITRLANEWVDGGASNYGILLKYFSNPTEEPNFSTYFSSKDGKYIVEEAYPQIIYQYINTTGLEDYYSYHTQSVGAAGTVYTNDLTGNVTVVNNLVSTGGSIMPLTASLIYNSNVAYKDSLPKENAETNNKIVTPYSAGWKLNWAQKLDRSLEDELGNPIVVYTDADGTEHYFTYESETGMFIDEVDKKRKIVWVSNTLYNLVDGTGVTLTFTRTDTTEKKWYLTKILDPYGNSTIINVVKDRVNSVETSTDNKLEFAYNTNGLLEEVKYFGENNVIKRVYVGYNTPPEENSSENNLNPQKDRLNPHSANRITYADGTVAFYEYTYQRNSPYLSKATDIDGYNIKYEYTITTSTDVPARVEKITPYDINSNWQNRLYITYDTKSTVFQSVIKNPDTTAANPEIPDKKYLYTFSTLGTLKSVVDTTVDDCNGYGQYYEYNDGEISKTQGKGNLTFMSKTQKSTVNKLRNHSYEQDEYTPILQAWSQTTGSSSGAFTTEKSHIGNRSYKLTRSADSNSTRSLGYIYSNIEEGKTYTLSAYVNTSQMVSNGKGASVAVGYNNKLFEGEYATTVSDEWQRVSVTITAQATATVTIIVSITGASGSVYFDNIQFEEGGLSDYNLVENAGFEYDNAANIDGWGGWSSYGSDLYFLSEAKIGGSRGAKFEGGIYTNQEYYQRIRVKDGKKDDVYVASAFAKATSVPSEGYRYSLLIRFVKGSTVVNEKNITFNSNTTEWQKIAGVAAAKGDYDYIMVWLLYYNNCNTVYFDNVQLIKDTFGNTYTYDENNNLISTTDLQNKSDYTFSYDGNNKLIGETSVSGGRIFYSYNPSIKTKLENVSSGGVTTSFTYDSYGNALSSTTYGHEFTEGKYYYIRNGHFGKYLEVANSGTTNGTNITSGELKKNSSQRWKFTKNSDGSYSLSPECAPNMLLSVEPATLSLTANVALYAPGAAVYQKFNLVKRDVNIYCLDVTQNTDYALDVGSKNVYVYETHHLDYQQFLLIPVENSQSAENPVITSSATYSDNGEYTKTTTDSRGQTTEYYYYNRGMLKSSETPNGTVTEYTYDNSEQLTKVLAGFDTDTTAVNYTYDNVNRLSSIKSPSNTVYNFTYDSFSRTDKIKIGNTVLSDYDYDYKGNLETMLYGNNTKVDYIYDDLNRKTGVEFNDTLAYSFVYDGKSRIAEVLDIAKNQKQKFVYDILDRLTGEQLISTLTKTPIAELKIRYDDTKNRVSGYDVNIEGVAKAIDYVYGGNNLAPDIISGVKQNNNTILPSGYDGLNRHTSRTIATTTPFVTNYTYTAGKTADKTTTLLATLKNGNDTLSYTYDEMGNIETVSKNNVTLETYDYDYLNQLTSVTVEKGEVDDVYTYEYDNGGNIKNVILETADSEEPILLKTYLYEEDGDWKDLLKSFNGDTITYDTIGNPTEYLNGMNFTWSQGRKLTGITKGTDSIAYTYNADGLRTSKTVNGTTTEYYWLNGILQGQKTGSEYILFLHDENGTAYGFLIKNGTTTAYYYYLFNAQGDVIGILDNTGTKVVEYTYDVWGKLLSTTGTLASTIGQTNPIRYRGYYYDSETSFYYLQSRYYDAETGRFVSPEPNVDYGEFDDGAGLLGYNVYTYCANNPIIYKDTQGTAIETVFDIASLIVSAVEVTINPTDLSAWAGLVGDAVDLIPFVTGVGETIKALRASSKIADGTDAAIDTYKNLRRVNKGTGKEVHHIVEKRFALSLDIKKPNNMLSIALDKNTHRDYTNAWRTLLPYGTNYGTQKILKAAAEVYKDNPILMGIVLFTLK